MEAKNAFSLLVYLRKDQLAKDGKAFIMVKITVKGKYSKFSSKLKVFPKDWDETTNRVKITCQEAQTINNKIEEILVSLRRYYLKFDLNDEIVTSEKIKNAFFGVDTNRETLLGLFDKFLADFKLQVNEGKNKSPKTLIKYEATYNRLSEFMKYKYNISDILLADLNYTFIVDFEIYLRTVSKNGTNTISKYMQQFKTIVLIAKNNNWIPVDPFVNYKIKKVKPAPKFLTPDELKIIEEKQMNFQRLEKIKDVFVFACYTGLSYSDIQKLRKIDLIESFDDKLWININRTKTNIESNIPILAIPMLLLKKYGYDEKNPNDTLFPVPSNQKLNSYLKEIADLCCISKKITFHVARHTFATSVTLLNGVPIETVSGMLGHTDIKTTQIYAQIPSFKIAKDMDELAQKIDRGVIKTETDKTFENLSIKQKLSIFNINPDLLNLESTKDLEKKTKDLWYGLNNEIKEVLIIHA